MAGIEIYSAAFSDGTIIPSRHAHDGGNVSPPLHWSGVPEGTTELLLMCEDPDAPDGTFLHWLVSGIDPHTDGVDEGRTPLGGKQWPNGFGEIGWGGPQPPRGDQAHRYVFRLYALRDALHLPAKPNAGDIHRLADAGAIADGSTVGLYQRQ
ncbi:MAG TPA: YbhB/YbcL family Raf kinase inhibitor-like protein [Micromonosporaceae bacterium]|nr:YbhB/YbcL family Raf kinase inhibitor-like protein [Micromonosporaceae bacterium]